jgi:holo-[acyl-carrier protein] synthase
MILGTGIDIIEIDRFAEWHTYSKKQLLRIFSDEEINYCLASPKKSAERFAARFAAREAFYKAYSSAFESHKIPFLTLCKAIEIVSLAGLPPSLILSENLLPKYFKINLKKIIIHCSLSHSKNMAIAQVILERNRQFGQL